MFGSEGVEHNLFVKRDPTDSGRPFEPGMTAMKQNRDYDFDESALAAQEACERGVETQIPLTLLRFLIQRTDESNL